MKTLQTLRGVEVQTTRARSVKEKQSSGTFMRWGDDGPLQRTFVTQEESSSEAEVIGLLREGQ